MRLLIFPASGVALAGVLLYGNRAFWGILLGSFLFNVTIPVVASDFSESLNSALISLAIAAGSGVQAVVGAYLVRRFAGFPNEFANEKSVLLFLFYGGIVSALVNSTFSISLLVITGRLPIDLFLLNWLTWWGGDALGIIIFAPLGVICMSPHNSAFQDRKMAATLPVLMMFFLTVAAVFYEVKSSNERVKLEFENNAEAMNTALKSSLTTHLNVLRSLKSLYAASEIVNPEEFKTFVTQLLTDFQGIQALGWNRRVLASERDAFEKSVQKGGYPNFQITERDTDKKLVRAGNRLEYYPVNFIEPYKGNESAAGYDVYSNEIRHEAINRAIDIDGLALTAKIVLVQEQGKQSGFLAFIPVYRRDLPHQTLEERRDALLGLVTAVFRGGDIIAAALKNQNLAGLSYRLIDETAPVTEQLIFASDEREFVPFVFQQKGIFGDPKTLIHSTVMPIGGRMWRFEIVPTPTYFVEHRATNVWFIFLGGIVLTILTILVALVSSGRQRTLQKILDNTDAINYELRLKSAENESRAAELVIANTDLAIANEELLFQSMETEKRAIELTRSYKENAVLIDQMNHMQKLESIGRLTSGLAHDFNNILACMLGFNEMNQYVAEDITDKKLSAELVNNTKQIDDAGKRAVSLIAKMMAYCRQDTKKEKMDVKPTQEVIKEVLTMLRPALTSRIKLDFVDICHINGSDCGTCGLRNHCNTDIQIDAIDLHQILTNLAVNARDAMKESGGTIAIFLKTTTIAMTHCLACATSVEGEFIELSVSDNGTGIKGEIIKRIFDPFFTTKEQGEGTGLGLSAVSGMVHRAGGHILIDSNLTEPNQGTTFRLLFPILAKV